MSDIIREFLVAIGFTVDDSGAKKADQRINKRATETEKREVAARKRQAKAIRETMKVVGELATAMSAAAAGVVAGVAKSADALEDLYWASQRIKSSVANIKAFSFGIAQMGGSADGALSSLEGLASFIRNNPGGERFLELVGVRTREAGGELRDTAELMGDLAAKFRGMPYWAAKVRADMLGIDEQTLQAMIRGVDQFGDNYHKVAAEMGVDADAAAKANMELARSIREMKARLELMWFGVVMRIMRAGGERLFQRFAETFVKFLAVGGRMIEWLVGLLDRLDRATDGWSTTLIALVAVLGPIILLLNSVVLGVLAVAGAIALLWDDYQTWKDGGDSLINWGQWDGEITAAVAALGNLGSAVLELVGYLGELAGAFLKAFGPELAFLAKFFLQGVIGLINGLAEAIHTVVALLRGDWKGAWSHAKGFVRAMAGQSVGDANAAATAAKPPADEGAEQARRRLEGVKVIAGQPGPVDPGLVAALRAQGDNALADQVAAKLGGGKPANDNAGQLAGSAALAREAYAFFRAKGWTAENAHGLVANIDRESKFNAKAVGDNGAAYGIAQWHKDRQDAFKAWAGKDIRDSSFQDQLGFMHHELTAGLERFAGGKLKQALTAGDSAAAVSRYYERPADAAGEAALRGRTAEEMFRTGALTTRSPASVTLNQTTNINVNGGEAAATGRAVAGEQERVNGNLLRNVKPKVE